MIQCALKGIPLGRIGNGGECTFNSNIFSLPDSLTRWWLHWGGGCISYSDMGEIIFAGSPGVSTWDVLGSWTGGSEISFYQEQTNWGMVRRQLALNKLFGQKNRVTYGGKA